MVKPCLVFCCFSHKDQEFLEDLKIHLKPLEREGLINLKADRDISPGIEWEASINHYLAVADIILLLISPDFIASDYCFNKEMQQAIARHERGTARVIPLSIRPASWRGMPFSVLQALPKDALPVSLAQNRDSVFLSIANGIRVAVHELTTGVTVNQALIHPTSPPSGSSRERSDMHTNEDASKYHIENNGPVGQQNFGGHHEHHETILVGKQKDGIEALKKGSEALWNGNYSSAIRELRVAVEEIEQKEHKKEASMAYYLLALATLGGNLPSTQGKAVVERVDELMRIAFGLCPYRAYYHILASILKNAFDHHRIRPFLNAANTLESQAATLPRRADDEEIERYFRRCQPRLSI